MNTETYYRNKIKQLTMFESPLYVSITPVNGLKSLEEFKFLIKKCFREISKKYNKTSSSNYLKYVSLIEINKSITTDKKLNEDEFFVSKKQRSKNKEDCKPLTKTELKIKNVREMGFHTHIFLKNSVEFWKIDTTLLKQCFTETFNNSGIEIDYYFSNTYNDFQGFITYHTKQLDKLDKSFILSNIN